MRKSKKYFFLLLFIRDEPLRRKVSQSIVNEYPNHNGKNSRCVRNPSSDQLKNQQTIIKVIPMAS